ncbi:protein RoBo-1-like [Talpa occidentalis]|uniref:protein RoBo-1-like n=1 Tax=Talpa occidentalis TaxID=50954 RepID=UPI00189060F9|nr:protein RoBo-1-like [Talpa occidentalis]
MTSYSALKNLITTYTLTTLIFSTVETYTCALCEKDCSPGALKTCETSQGCFSFRQEVMAQGHQSQHYDLKGCSSSICVPFAFRISVSNGSLGFASKCCQTDRCNQEDIKLPQKSSVPNGITCPSCERRNNQFYCDQVPLACTGAETKCITIFDSAHSGLPNIMGCATETACNLKNFKIQDGTVFSTLCAGLSSGSPPLTSITSSILIGVFLLKALL